MAKNSDSTIKSYGMLKQHLVGSQLDAAVEEIKNQGFTVVSGNYSNTQIEIISEAFNNVWGAYQQQWGEEYLSAIDEQYSVRLPMSSGNKEIVNLALNANILELITRVIKGKFQLNQQNFVINPAEGQYAQGAWHRDLPYQHFVSSYPLALNALYCVDHFSSENGASYVIPASHKIEEFPSEQYIKKHQYQVEAKAGDFIVMDCMTFHRGGSNTSGQHRRAVNHVYSIPFIKQQINIPDNIDHKQFSSEQLQILGVDYMVPDSVEAYLKGREQQKG